MLTYNLIEYPDNYLIVTIIFNRYIFFVGYLFKSYTSANYHKYFTLVCKYINVILSLQNYQVIIKFVFA